MADTPELNDGGTRLEYDTGAMKEDWRKTEGKGRYDLLPPEAIQRIAEVYRKGAIKYGDRNWQQGIPLSRFMDSGLRHLFQHLAGKTDEDHLAQAAWNVIALIWTETRIQEGKLPKELNDLDIPL